MKTFTQLIKLNALFAIGVGIFCALYGPLIMAYFGIPEIPDSNILAYWHTAAFVRMFGAMLFGLGLVLWAVHQPSVNFSATERRGLISALLLAHIMGLFVAITQQFAIWESTAGWAMTGIFGFFTLAYGYYWLKPPDETT